MKSHPIRPTGFMLAFAILILAHAGLVRAQTPLPPPPAPPPPAPVVLSPLDQLLAPIALYPDPLIALILPASADSVDINKAAEYLGVGGDPSLVDEQNWDPSVKALAHYPAIVAWMAQNAQWTDSLGAAFAASPNDVMASIQRLRAIARAAGTLTDNSQQIVVMEGNNIAIEPAEPDAMYVPIYDPSIVYATGPYYGYNGPFITFGIAYPVGPWLGYGFDWRRRCIWVGDWRNWHGPQGWAHPLFPGDHGYVHGADSHRLNAPVPHFVPRSSFMSQSYQGAIAHPRPMPGAPPPPRPQYRAEPRQNMALPVMRHEASPAMRTAPGQKSEPSRDHTSDKKQPPG